MVTLRIARHPTRGSEGCHRAAGNVGNYSQVRAARNGSTVDLPSRDVRLLAGK